LTIKNVFQDLEKVFNLAKIYIKYLISLEIPKKMKSERI